MTVYQSKINGNVELVDFDRHIENAEGLSGHAHFGFVLPPYQYTIVIKSDKVVVFEIDTNNLSKKREVATLTRSSDEYTFPGTHMKIRWK
jgi:6-phosphogluconolactonase (cycloisomerase 2 family)